jgi:hypothetical protein
MTDTPISPPPQHATKIQARNKPIDGIWSSPGINILQAGMTGFGSPDMGSMDHRLPWVDFSVNSIFGYRPPQLAPIEQVGVPMRNPEIGQRLNVKLRKARNKNNIPNQIMWLEQRAKDKTFNQHDAQLFETLIKLDDELREKCKHSIRKKHAGAVPYSDVIGKDSKEIRMWKLVIKRSKSQQTDTRKIRHLMNTVEIPNAVRLTTQEAEKALKECYARYKINKGKSEELRKAFELTEKTQTELSSTQPPSKRKKRLQNTPSSQNLPSPESAKSYRRTHEKQ